MTLDLQQAEAALARGEYGQCLALLEPLAEIYLLPGAKGGQIRLLMVTAWIGQGQYENALTTYATEQIGYRRRDEYEDGMVRQQLKSKPPSSYGTN